MILIDAIGLDAVRRARQQDRIRLRLVLGDVDGGEELHAVAHRDAVFVLGVVGLDVFQALSGDLAAARSEQDQERAHQQRRIANVVSSRNSQVENQTAAREHDCNTREAASERTRIAFLPPCPCLPSFL